MYAVSRRSVEQRGGGTLEKQEGGPSAGAWPRSHVSTAQRNKSHDYRYIISLPEHQRLIMREVVNLHDRVTISRMIAGVARLSIITGHDCKALHKVLSSPEGSKLVVHKGHCKGHERQVPLPTLKSNEGTRSRHRQSHASGITVGKQATSQSRAGRNTSEQTWARNQPVAAGLGWRCKTAHQREPPT